MAQRYNFRTRNTNSRPSAPPIARRKRWDSKNTAGRLLTRFAQPKKKKIFVSKKHPPKPTKKQPTKKKKQPDEPTHVKAIYWVRPEKKDDDYFINVEWFGLGGQYPFSLSDLLDGGERDVANECQIEHGKYADFSEWFMNRAVLKQQQLMVNGIVYDINGKKFLEIVELPHRNQLYVWPGFENYYIGKGREFDPFERIIGSGNGYISDAVYFIYVEDIEVVANLPSFYMKQNAMDTFKDVLKSKLSNQFKKGSKPRRLRFYEYLSGKIWKHYIKERLDEYEEDIDVDDGVITKKWTLSFEQADGLFPVATGSLFEKIIGKRRYYVDDMDFVFNTKINKLRIYSVILTQDTKHKTILGNDLEKR